MWQFACMVLQLNIKANQWSCVCVDKLINSRLPTWNKRSVDSWSVRYMCPPRKVTGSQQSGVGYCVHGVLFAIFVWALTLVQQTKDNTPWSRRFTELYWQAQFRELVIGFIPQKTSKDKSARGVEQVCTQLCSCITFILSSISMARQLRAHAVLQMHMFDAHVAFWQVYFTAFDSQKGQITCCIQQNYAIGRWYMLKNITMYVSLDLAVVPSISLPRCPKKPHTPFHIIPMLMKSSWVKPALHSVHPAAT